MGVEGIGASVLRKEEKLGHRASSTAALAFDQCRVPRANLLGKPGQRQGVTGEPPDTVTSDVAV